ncbi:Clan CA, family C19, ubiquitin hydrolase-like cysteine peptidase [Trichomonas vaginalis G3]|uniref:Clan CA, family C19, ubiquitin hydrolase-like cysteine peptidase n=1 Tax=Trichomonas vaginalis (strain ATCC PRA-98 / G3) TaxID=412133 RepID=A2FNL3_TRIV3|nr:ubiquitinyl hydrolase protein [Trichomonas vaginalis G3]EAX93513.1 Clan CA, family C19, ubiquitin hydrolase-like cysteine peptidase [Trichomonas vaginalis G3]KAI5511586.1 ubiquitinyl hydrolase protein [Trichomonas vaginalis G3]|eukprot:XP_001306443.1 Clan CA, family C19, ubiquitin hydrolase-like cysteine peptidase [Trichomonas vaginalis G3]
MKYLDKVAITTNLTLCLGWSEDDIYEMRDVEETLHIFFDLLSLNIPESVKPIEGKCYINGNDTPFFDVQIGVQNLDNIENSLEALKITGYYFLKLPDVMIFHLRRTVYNQEQKKNWKVLDYFEYHNEIEINHVKYRLFQVIVHAGSVNRGHYFAYIKPKPDSSFYLFNDSKVSISDDLSVFDKNFGGRHENGRMKWSSAYLLVYVKVDSIPIVFSEIDESEINPILFAEADRKEEINPFEFQFFISTEEGLIENSLMSKPSILNTNVRKCLYFEGNLSKRDLYERICLDMKSDISEVRLWTIGSGGKIMEYVKPDESLISELPKSLFLEKIKGNETKSDIENDEIILFIHFYFKEEKSPIQYLSSVVTKKSNKLRDLFNTVSKLLNNPTEKNESKNSLLDENGNDKTKSYLSDDSENNHESKEENAKKENPILNHQVLNENGKDNNLNLKAEERKQSNENRSDLLENGKENIHYLDAKTEDNKRENGTDLLENGNDKDKTELVNKQLNENDKHDLNGKAEENNQSKGNQSGKDNNYLNGKTQENQQSNERENGNQKSLNEQGKDDLKQSFLSDSDENENDNRKEVNQFLSDDDVDEDYDVYSIGLTQIERLNVDEEIGKLNISNGEILCFEEKDFISKHCFQPVSSDSAYRRVGGITEFDNVINYMSDFNKRIKIHIDDYKFAFSSELSLEEIKNYLQREIYRNGNDIYLFDSKDNLVQNDFLFKENVIYNFSVDFCQKSERISLFTFNPSSPKYGKKKRITIPCNATISDVLQMFIKENIINDGYIYRFLEISNGIIQKICDFSDVCANYDIIRCEQVPEVQFDYNSDDLFPIVVGNVMKDGSYSVNGEPFLVPFRNGTSELLSQKISQFTGYRFHLYRYADNKALQLKNNDVINRNDLIILMKITA